LTIASAANSYGTIYWADGTSGSELYDGYIIYYHGTQTMQIGTAGALRMHIDSSGNVGIGTTSPIAFGPSLHVAGTDPAFILQDTATAVDYLGCNITSGAVTTWFDDGAHYAIGTASGVTGTGYIERWKSPAREMC